jgi:hypothetical protein
MLYIEGPPAETTGVAWPTHSASYIGEVDGHPDLGCPVG